MQINKAKFSYLWEILVCKLKIKCMYPYSIILFNQSIHSTRLTACVRGSMLGTGSSKSKETVSCSQIVHSPPHEADKQTHCEQNSFAIMGNNNKTMVCKTVIGTGPGHCVTTGEEPVIQPQGIRKAILEENLENEKQKRS